MRFIARLFVVSAALAVVLPDALNGQAAARIEVSPNALSLSVGDTIAIAARAIDAAGNVLDVPLLFFSSSRRRLEVNREDGTVIAHGGGEYTISVRVLAAGDVTADIPVSVEFPPLTGITLSPAGERFFVGASVRHSAEVVDATRDVRDVTVRWSTSDPSIASVNRFGVLTAHREGTFSVTARADDVTESHEYRAVVNPVRTLTLSASQDSARTGDVIHFEATALDARGQPVPDAPITFSLIANPEDSAITQSSTAEVDQGGRFVAEKAGDYTVLAVAPGHVAQQTVEITTRMASREIEFIGQGRVSDVATSDLWIWEGVDGRDYAVTGTHRAHGAAYFWDVTDASSPLLIDSVVVDARTVNDVKISEDGRIAVISREGASNRRNGIVVLDVANPRDVQILSAYDDELTGGVHNVFVYQDHVYAVNNGRRFDVINIADPRNPHRVSRFELDTPGHGIHDIWIVNGIAYTSNWSDGLVMIDVGNGRWGGSPSNPVEITRFRDSRGNTHAAFPYQSPTGRFYVFMGDETGRRVPGGEREGAPSAMAGYFHVVDLTDPENPEEVARYDVPEAGSHNLWIEDDVLYAAYYNGGMRVVDISGELKGNLYSQNREIAHYMPFDPDGFVPNAPMTWGGQPYKGNLFFADYHSGLWAVKVAPRTQSLTP